MKKKILGALLAIAICELVGSIGSIFTIPAIGGWYAGLAKPSLNPPNWIFGPVWTTLFALMGIAAFMVWNKRKNKAAKTALMIFALQLVLNVLWSVLFFGAHRPAGAFLDIILMWFAILWTIFAFWKIDRAAAWLLAPYLLWVSFAAYLNYAVMVMN
jgi:tryptophan-rich sensory protein